MASMSLRPGGVYRVSRSNSGSASSGRTGIRLWTAEVTAFGVAVRIEQVFTDCPLERTQRLTPGGVGHSNQFAIPKIVGVTIFNRFHTSSHSSCHRP